MYNVCYYYNWFLIQRLTLSFLVDYFLASLTDQLTSLSSGIVDVANSSKCLKVELYCHHCPLPYTITFFLEPSDSQNVRQTYVVDGKQSDQMVYITMPLMNGKYKFIIQPAIRYDPIQSSALYLYQIVTGSTLCPFLGKC